MTAEQNIEAKNVFLDACDLKGAERARFLDEACEGNTQLRSDVQALLDCDDANELVTARTLPTIGDVSRSTQKSTRRLIETGHRKVGRWERVFSTRFFLWAALLILVVTVCIQARHQFKRYLLEARSEELATVLDLSTRHLQIWIERNVERTEFWTRNGEVLELIRPLVSLDLADPNDLELLKNSEVHPVLEKLLDPMIAGETASGYELVDPNGLILSSDAESIIGMRIKQGWAAQREWRLRGNPLFALPLRSYGEVEGFDDSNSIRIITFSLPFRDSAGKVIALLSRNMMAEVFSGILETATFGDTGETYAFNNKGVLVTESRFIDELESLGMVTEEDGLQSMLAVAMRDPGGDLLSGFQSRNRDKELPWTRSAQQALSVRTELGGDTRSGIISEPYRNYLGRQVIGAWKWIPTYGLPFGVVTEIEVDEALEPLRILNASVWMLFFVSLGVMGISAFASRNLRREGHGGSGATGQYELIRKIGEGGLGEVFLAEHIMMKRPTAIKLLKEDVANADSIKRFEREVQLASRLTHPNTIQIHDYGYTGEGQFYYAMEYLEGLNLTQVVVEEGGALPVGRVISILLQTCQSLAEAHQMGLIHRDIKPLNIMLSQRGGLFDVVKVLDFGLVKKIENQETSELTAPHQLSGTLLYLAPERIRNPQAVDARTDLYSVGALGYYLLTGDSPFPRKTDLDVLYRVVNETPDLPSLSRNESIPADLERLIMACLKKDMNDRPDRSTDVIADLSALAQEFPWTQSDARSWWESHTTNET